MAGATPGPVSGFEEVGGVVGVVAVLPAERQTGKGESHLAALTNGRRYCKAKCYFMWTVQHYLSHWTDSTVRKRNGRARLPVLKPSK